MTAHDRFTISTVGRSPLGWQGRKWQAACHVLGCGWRGRRHDHPLDASFEISAHARDTADVTVPLPTQAGAEDPATLQKAGDHCAA